VVMHPPLETGSGLAAVLRGIVTDMQHVSGADIVSISLYDEGGQRYYAPFATGQPQESLLGGLEDMTSQLHRYADDRAHDKVPDELGSTFVRRYKVQSTIGLPLIAGDKLVGIVYLNYRNRDQVPDSRGLA